MVWCKTKEKYLAPLILWFSEIWLSFWSQVHYNSLYDARGEINNILLIFCLWGALNTLTWLPRSIQCTFFLFNKKDILVTLQICLTNTSLGRSTGCFSIYMWELSRLGLSMVVPWLFFRAPPGDNLCDFFPYSSEPMACCTCCFLMIASYTTLRTDPILKLRLLLVNRYTFTDIQIDCVPYLFFVTFFKQLYRYTFHQFIHFIFSGRIRHCHPESWCPYCPPSLTKTSFLS
jgi:hypothetical protein